MAETIAFYLIAAVALGAALTVIMSRQPVYSVLCLLVTMFALAILFMMLGAYVVAALQILLYAGAVLVLFLFVLMLLNLSPEQLRRVGSFRWRWLGMLMAGLLGGQFARLLSRPAPALWTSGNPPPSGTVAELGRALFTTYLLPFELTSFLMLAAIIGAVTLARGLRKSD
ncbi:MAG: NADH-quinone oxidoreductase subunit J [Candidatus Omnitrophica bacterium]|nr:NADH-quinone oxidoreductase subunit J [Candidatus Omnitrophota bacterium]